MGRNYDIDAYAYLINFRVGAERSEAPASMGQNNTTTTNVQVFQIFWVSWMH